MSSYGPLAQWYDCFTTDIPYGDFATYYTALFKERGKTIRSLLDLACGTGTLTCMMAERGYDLTAVDGSSEMLACLAEKVETLKVENKPLLLCQDLCELDLYGTVDGAYCSLDGINYLPPEDLPEVFHRLHLFLEPGGLLIFDINSPDRLRELDGQTFVDETEDALCLWRAEFSEEEQLLFYGMDLFIRQGNLWRREEEEHIEYAHTPQLLERLLKVSGFEKIEKRLDGPQHGEGRIFIVAENVTD